MEARMVDLDLERQMRTQRSDVTALFGADGTKPGEPARPS